MAGRVSLLFTSSCASTNEQCLLGTTTNTWSRKYWRSKSFYTTLFIAFRCAMGYALRGRALSTRTAFQILRSCLLFKIRLGCHHGGKGQHHAYVIRYLLIALQLLVQLAKNRLPHSSSPVTWKYKYGRSLKNLMVLMPCRPCDSGIHLGRSVASCFLFAEAMSRHLLSSVPRILSSPGKSISQKQ